MDIVLDKALIDRFLKDTRYVPTRDAARITSTLKPKTQKKFAFHVQFYYLSHDTTFMILYIFKLHIECIKVEINVVNWPKELRVHSRVGF